MDNVDPYRPSCWLMGKHWKHGEHLCENGDCIFCSNGRWFEDTEHQASLQEESEDASE